MRRHAATGVALIAVFALVACAPVGDAAWTPPEWTPSEIEVVEAPRVIDLAADSSVAAALVPQRLRNTDVAVQARFAVLSGTGAAATSFNDAAMRSVRDAVSAASAASGVAYTPMVHPQGAGLADRACVAGSTQLPAAELLADPAVGAPGGRGTAIACDIVSAAGTIVGQRLRTVVGTPDGVSSDVSAIVYVDTAAGDAASAEALWAEGAAERLSADVVDALRRADGALTWQPASPGDEAQIAAIAAALGTTVPTADGGLAFTIPAGFTAPELAALGTPATGEPITIGVPREIAQALVTDFGARVLAAGGTPFSSPAAGPAGADRVDCGLFPCVAVTYDDGPSPLTPAVLDALAHARGAATFYVMGEKAGAYRELLQRMIAEGHEAENHTWNHPHLPALAPDRVTAQITDTSNAISSATGVAVRSFRPPYGEYTRAVLDAAGLPAILWDVDTLDWQGPAADELVRRAVDGPRAGSIVLQHDIHPVTAETAAAVYAGLADRGFTLVTVTQLFGGQLPASGAYRRAP